MTSQEVIDYFEEFYLNFDDYRYDTSVSVLDAYNDAEQRMFSDARGGNLQSFHERWSAESKKLRDKIFTDSFVNRKIQREIDDKLTDTLREQILAKWGAYPKKKWDADTLERIWSGDYYGADWFR